jgi:predicted small secreted protein
MEDFAKEGCMKIRKIMGFSMAALFFSSLLLLAGCETTAGVGRDMEAAGDAIEDSAERNQPYESPRQDQD